MAPDFPAALLDEERVDTIDLPEADTGIAGIVSISTRQGRRGPRVEWFSGRPRPDAPCLAVTIESAPKVFDLNLPDRVAAAAGESVVRWVSLNQVALTRFWFEGISWTSDEVATFRSGLRKAA